MFQCLQGASHYNGTHGTRFESHCNVVFAREYVGADEARRVVFRFMRNIAVQHPKYAHVYSMTKPLISVVDEICTDSARYGTQISFVELYVMITFSVTVISWGRCDKNLFLLGGPL
eukprot:gb/GEZJ01009578.1/.p1 GENE.gb/GEZJ01009578.1/~~gb/GEZJ01009578.1/.p1  ORF type:complete len:116 (+),score=4.27 gb/GEZJ01009578.1/:464-811(+)